MSVDSEPISTRNFEPRDDPSPTQRVLIVIYGGRVQRHRLPVEGRLVIGRDPGCDLPVADENVSRRHLCLHLRPSELSIEDLGSSNGSHLRGTRLQAGVAVGLALHEPVELASTVLVVQPASTVDAPGLMERCVPILSGPHQFEQTRELATSDGPIAVIGPAGSGKSTLAGVVHRLQRCAGRIVHLDPATIDPKEREPTLFGIERSGTAGATLGQLEACHGGTLVLDRIEELSTVAQERLLDCIERKSLRRDGGFAQRRVDARLIVTSCDPLTTLVRTGGLTRRFAHRLLGRTLTLEGLDARKDQLPHIVGQMLRHIATEQAVSVPEVEEAFVETLSRSTWPGNLRQLEATLQRAMSAAKGSRLGPEHLPDDVDTWNTELDPRASTERRNILEALRRCNGNQTAAARLLGISRRTLVNRLDLYGIPRPRKDNARARRRQ